MSANKPHDLADSAGLQMRGIFKSFSGNPAVEDVTFAVEPGQIHALVGENGAGKSTLMAIAAGALQPDEGTVLVCAVETTGNAKRTSDQGLAMAYQDDALVPDLSVADNLLLSMGDGPSPRPWHRVRWAQGRLDEWVEGLDASAYVRDLTVSQRHLVEIVRAFESQPSVLLLDEPTAALTDHDVQLLFNAVRKLAQQGVGITFISHRLPEVLQIADVVTVMRDGRVVVSAAPTKDLTEPQLVEWMVGRQITNEFARDHARDLSGADGLRVNNLSGRRFHDVSMQVGAGEIVGLAGIEGNGQVPFLRALAGIEHIVSGSATFMGEALDLRNSGTARQSGLAYVSSDRKTESLIPTLGISQNSGLGILDKFTRGGLIQSRPLESAVESALTEFDVRYASADQSVAELSGGNQQKVALARAILQQPRVLLVEEPTQGVDVGAKAEIYASLRRIAASGTSILVLSTDAIELAGICDRVAVMSRGRIAAELSGPDLTDTKILASSLQATTQNEGGSTEGGLSPWRRFATGDWLPVVLLTVVLAAIMMLVANANSLFVAQRNLTSLMSLALPLCLAGLAQTAVMLIGRIDLSIGPVVALSTVVSTHLMTKDGGTSVTAFAIAAALAAGVAVGMINGFLVVVLRVNAIIATLATYILVQGVALQIAPIPGGESTAAFSDWTKAKIGFIPLWTVVVVLAAIAAEFFYRWHRKGLRYRTVGSRELVTSRLAIPAARYLFIAFMIAGFLAALAGVFFASKTNVGNATLGVSFTLASVTAAVLGGLSTFGGRGSVVGCIVGAFFLAVASNAFSFLNFPTQSELLLTGLATLLAIGLYSRLRSSGSGPL